MDFQNKAEAIHDSLKEGFESAGYLEDVTELYSELADCIRNEGLSEEEVEQICYDENLAFKPESMIEHIIQAHNLEGIKCLQFNIDSARIESNGSWRPSNEVQGFLNRCKKVALNHQK